MEYKKKCIICEKEFVAKKSDAQCCSKKCSNKKQKNDGIKWWNNNVLNHYHTTQADLDNNNGYMNPFPITKIDVDNISGDEIWKAIDIDSEFFISNLGRVWRREKGLIYQTDARGYKQVCLNNKSVNVHRLVAMAFCKKIDNTKDIVNHIDSDRANNHFENLEWVSQSENIIHGYDFGKMNKESVKRKVIQLTLDGNFICEFGSIKEASSASGAHNGSICNCCRGVRMTAGGYKWVYKEDYD